MYLDLIAWDAEDDPDGNYQHIVGTGEITAEEVEEVLSGHHGSYPDAYSDATGNPIIFGRHPRVSGSPSCTATSRTPASSSSGP